MPTADCKKRLLEEFSQQCLRGEEEPRIAHTGNFFIFFVCLCHRRKLPALALTAAEALMGFLASDFIVFQAIGVGRGQ